MAHARAGQGGCEEEDLPEVDGRGGGGAAGSCLGNWSRGRLARRQAGQAVVSVPGTREAREAPLAWAEGPWSGSFLCLPKPARGSSAEGLQSGGRARLTEEGRGAEERVLPRSGGAPGRGTGSPHLRTQAKVSGGEEGASPSAPAGTLAMTGKSVKDVDRYQAVLANLLLEEDNKFCADCQSKGSVSPPTPSRRTGGPPLPRRRAWAMVVWGGGFRSFGRPVLLNGHLVLLSLPSLLGALRRREAARAGVRVCCGGRGDDGGGGVAWRVLGSVSVFQRFE